MMTHSSLDTCVQIILGLGAEGLKNLAVSAGQPGCQGGQIHDWPYRREADSFASMTNMPNIYRGWLAGHCRTGQNALVKVDLSSDGTRKYHFGAGLQGGGQDAMGAFQNLLKDKGSITTIRRSRGLDIQAACSLLSTKEQTGRCEQENRSCKERKEER
jgi:adenine C2-methylase RlmN of 23S rRNA A2503 and tRNA A37